MEANGLKQKNFEDSDKALAAAQELLEAYNAEHPDIAMEHPPKLFENPLLCKYWYAPDASGHGSHFQHLT